MPSFFNSAGEKTETREIGYRPDVDGLRAIAVCAVVFFHAFQRYLPGGFLGVDIFFVISGFLITKIIFVELQREEFHLLNFYTRRIRRIVPALLVVLIFCLVLGWYLSYYDDYRLLGKNIAASAGFVANLQLLREVGYFDLEAEFKPLLHLWSLGVEEQFYLVWPFFLSLAFRSRRIATAVICVLLVSFLINIFIAQRNEAAAFFLPITRFWELMLGALLAIYQLQGLRLRLVNLWARSVDIRAWVGFILIASSFVFVPNGRAFSGTVALAPTFGAVLIISATENAWLNRVLLASKPAIFVGLISYAFYLWHWPILSFARIHAAGDDLSILDLVLLILLSFILAVITFFFIERPLRKIPWGIFKKYVSLGLLVLLAGVASAGLFVYRTKVALLRYSPEVRALMERELNDKLAKEFPVQEKTGPWKKLKYAVDVPTSELKPLLLLWGDSHAAHLISAFRVLQHQSGSFRFAEFTAPGCPPVPRFDMPDRENCGDINNFVLKEIKELKPDIVVLAAYWYKGGFKVKDKGRTWTLDIDALIQAIHQLQTFGIKQIVVMGGIPTWKMRTGNIMAEFLVNKQPIPMRTFRRFDFSSLSIDKIIAPAVEKAGALYFVPSPYLCASDGCTIQVREGAAAYSDNAHLTTSGALLVLRPLLGQLNLLEQPH